MMGLTPQIQEVGAEASKMEGLVLIEAGTFDTASPRPRMSCRRAVYPLIRVWKDKKQERVVHSDRGKKRNSQEGLCTDKGPRKQLRRHSPRAVPLQAGFETPVEL